MRAVLWFFGAMALVLSILVTARSLALGLEVFLKRAKIFLELRGRVQLELGGGNRIREGTSVG